MPFRRSKPWGNIKPPVGYGVNRGDQISQGLVGCWLFNEGAGIFVWDIARRNRGTLLNAPVWTPGKFGNALRFVNANSQAIDLGIVPSSLQVQTLTINAWVNYAGFVGYFSFSAIVGGGDNNANPTISGDGVPELRINSNGQLEFLQQGIALLGTSSGTVATGSWQFVSVTYDRSGNIAFYINGVPAGTASSLVTFLYNYHYYIGLGYRSVGSGYYEYFNGKIDNIRIYNRALLASEIKRLYTEQFAGIQTPRRRIISAVVSAPGGLSPLSLRLNQAVNRASTY